MLRPMSAVEQRERGQAHFLYQDDFDAIPNYSARLRSDDPAIRDGVIREVHELFPVKNVRQFLGSLSDSYRDLPAIVDGRDRRVIISYQDLPRLVDQAALTLLRLGIEPKMRVGIVSENSVEATIAMMACESIGVVTTPWTALPEESGMSTSQAMHRARVDRILASNGVAMANARKTLPAECCIDTALMLSNTLTDVLGEFQPPQVLREAQESVLLSDPAMAMFSTGSGGDQPKLIQHSHASLLYPALTAPPVFDQPPGAPALHMLPMYHIYGASVCMILLSGGACITLTDAREHQKTKGALQKEIHPRFIATIPFALRKTVDGVREVLDQRAKRSGVEKFIVGCIDEALAENARDAAIKDISLTTRLKVGHVLEEQTREFWDLALRNLPAEVRGISGSVRQAIGKLLIRFSVLRRAGMDHLRQDEGIVISGAGGLPAEATAIFLAMGIHLKGGYGSTEGSIVTIPHPFREDPVLSSGGPIAGVEVWTGTGEHEGELCIAGANVADGSLDDHGKLDPNNGLIRSGDYAEVYEVSPGERAVTITGRKKRMFKKNGVGILPQQIEPQINGGFVKESFLVQAPDERIGALIDIDEGHLRAVLCCSDDPSLVQMGRSEEPLDYRSKTLRAFLVGDISARAGDVLRKYRLKMEHVAVVQFPSADEHTHLRTLKLELHVKNVEQEFAKEIEEMFREEA